MYVVLCKRGGKWTPEASFSLKDNADYHSSYMIIMYREENVDVVECGSLSDADNMCKQRNADARGEAAEHAL